jgi:hypothetical protein
MNELEDAVGNLRDFLLDLQVGGDGSGGSGGGGGGGGIRACRRCTITAVEDEYLTTTDADSGASIIVAKPYHFRVSTFDGNMIGDITYARQTAQRRRATGTITFNYGETVDATEFQRIFPAYTVGDELTAGQIPSVSLGGADMTYIDLNVDGRLWVRETDVLVAGL